MRRVFAVPMRSETNRQVRNRAATQAARSSKPPAAPPAAPARPAPPPAVPVASEDLKAVPLGRASDEELMRRAQQDDRQAFSLLYERYSASVLSYLYRMLGNLEDVESIGQEVFLRAFRFRGTYRYPQKLATWLFTITRNLAINQSRRRRRSPIRNITELNLDGMDISGDPYQVAARATDDVEKQEEIARVLVALDALPTDQKEVIVLGIFQDLSYAEMEDITGTKAVTLRSRMFHGLKRLARSVGVVEEEPQ
jgi:RNA polymerase sigma-70 factor (ECF subfamily)